MIKTIKPERLRPGDKVGLISPSNSVVERKEAFDKAIDFLEKELSIQIEIAPYAMGRNHYSSGTIAERLSDLHQMAMDPTIKAIWFTVGGNTAIDLLDGIDFHLIKNNPKIISGISDATTLLNAITAKTGLITYLGFELTDFGKFKMPYEMYILRKTWFETQPISWVENQNWINFDGSRTSYNGWQTIKPGKTSGKIVGGNFGSFYQLINTPYSMQFKDSILVMETYKFNKRGIHQALRMLELQGVLAKINGLIIGYCLGSDEESEYGNKRSMKDMVLEVTADHNFPIMWIGEIGHKVENIIVPIGAELEMEANNSNLSISEGVVK